MANSQFSPAQGISVDTHQDSGHCLYVVNSDLVITYVNPVYLKFAEENGGSAIGDEFSVGCHVIDVIEGPLREFYDDLYRRCLESGEAIEHEYECSSGDEFRKFRMHAFPIGESHGIMVDHSLIVSRAHDRVPHGFEPNLYVNGQGILQQCGHCRQIKNLKTNSWDWCPDALGRLKISHGLCEWCRDYYFPKSED